MIPPKLLLGTTLVFWGQLNDLLIWSIFMALSLEISWLIKWRRSTSNKNFYSSGDLCTILFVIISAIAFFNNEQRLFIYQIIEWLPFAFFPLLLMETYADRDNTPLGALVYQYRSRHDSRQKDINMRYLYFFLCLLSASVTTQRTEWFFPIAVCLLGLALWKLKPQSIHPARWLVVFVLTGCFGLIVGIGIFKLHRVVEEYSLDFIESMFDSARDPYQSTTAMGKIGKLKLSSKILMRIRVESNSLLAPQQSFLLHEAAYNLFYDNAWFNKKIGFEKLAGIENQNAWRLANPLPDPKTATIRIINQSGKSRGLLALPSNASIVSTDADLSLSRNELGAVQFRANPLLDEYELTLQNNSFYTSKVTDADLLVPATQRRIITHVSNELQLKTLPQQAAILSIERYFSTNFFYTTYLRQARIRNNALANFFNSHAGHCEYFASATVLLLRSAGIPARYSVGYSVQEFDPIDNLYVVRARHRHAWATAYIEGKWIDIDTTPSIWLQSDKETASFFEPLSDWISHIQYRLRLWQQSNAEETFSDYYLIIAIILLMLFLLRLKGKNLWSKPIPPKQIEMQAANSPEYFRQIQRIHTALQVKGITWSSHQPLQTWKQGLLRKISTPTLEQSLGEIIQLYYLLRHDPNRHTHISITDLESKVDLWLEQYHASESTIHNKLS